MAEHKRPIVCDRVQARHRAAAGVAHERRKTTHNAQTFDWDRAIELLHATLRHVYRRRR